MPANTITATCVGVVKIYWTAKGEVLALKGIDALFSAGTVTAVVRPSGSGKTSLLRILAGLDRPTAGSIMGYVFQRLSDILRVRSRCHGNLVTHFRCRLLLPAPDIVA